MQKLTALAATLIFLCLLLPAAAEEEYPVPEGGFDIVMTFGGDCTIGSDEKTRMKPDSFVATIEKNGMDYPFEKIRSLFQDDDLTVVNFEGVLVNDGRGKSSAVYNFRGDTGYTDILKKASIEAVSLGNNHSDDFGEKGALSTLNTLRDAGIGAFGDTPFFNEGYIYEKNGVRIGFAGFYYSDWIGTPDRIDQTFARLREAKCDLIIGALHGGSEYAGGQDGHQKRMANWMIKRGARFIFGHHPHVPHGIETCGDVTVLYSLGNLCFGGNRRVKVAEGADKALVARVRFIFGQNRQYLGHQVRLYPVQPSGTLPDNNYQPILASGKQADQLYKKLCRLSTVKFAPFKEGTGTLLPFVPAAAPLPSPVLSPAGTVAPAGTAAPARP